MSVETSGGKAGQQKPSEKKKKKESGKVYL